LASVLVTTTLVAPAAWAGVVAAIVVLFTTVTAVAEVPPSFTVAPARNPVPLMVTAVAPLMVPLLGEIEVTVGAGFAVEYVKALVSVALCISVFVTTTLTAPAAWAGVVAVIEVLLTIVTPVAAVPPTLTVAPARKPVPVTVTAVPPLMFPELGVIEVTVGAGLGEGLEELDLTVPPPQPGNRNATSNKAQTGNQCLGDIKGN
jgi:hypothetical protein